MPDRDDCLLERGVRSRNFVNRRTTFNDDNDRDYYLRPDNFTEIPP